MSKEKLGEALQARHDHQKTAAYSRNVRLAQRVANSPQAHLMTEGRRGGYGGSPDYLAPGQARERRTTLGRSPNPLGIRKPRRTALGAENEE